MTTRSIRALYGLLSAFLLSLPLLLGGLHLALLAGAPVPLFGEVAAYVGASMGALALGLGLLCLGVALEPARARPLALPLSAAFFGLALVRLVAFAFGTVLQEAGLGPAVAAEVVGFSVLGTIVGISWPGATPLGALCRRFLGQIPRLPLGLRVWLVVLVASIFVAPVLAWGHRAGPVMLLAQAVNLGGFVLYVHMGGLVRGLGLSHLVAWAVPVALAAWEAAALGAPGDVAEVALWAMAVVPGLSLVVDAVDLVRWGMGERGELVSPSAPASAGPAAASPP